MQKYRHAGDFKFQGHPAAISVKINMDDFPGNYQQKLKNW